MWILPKNYPLSSHFAQDMVASKEDLTLPGLNIESSLMWRSKPSPLRLWSTRWKTGSYLQHLFTRILKPSQRKSFEAALTSSLAVTPANLSQQQERGSEQMTQDTCGLTSGDTLNQLDLFSASLKTSKDISRLDSPQSSAIWKKMVIDRRGEYSARRKLALHTAESASTFWLTPRAMEVDESYENYQNRMRASGHPKNVGKTRPANLTMQVKMAKTRNPMTNSLPDAIQSNSGRGHLNPEWVEWLMGVPTGWTGLGSWGTESCQQQPPKRG